MRVPAGGSDLWILLISLRIPPKRGKDDGEMSDPTKGNVQETRRHILAEGEGWSAPGGGIARTGATGGAMLPSLVAWSSSLKDDLHFRGWDLVGSAAHVTMLARAGLVSADDAKALRDALLELLSTAAVGSRRELERERRGRRAHGRRGGARQAWGRSRGACTRRGRATIRSRSTCASTCASRPRSCCATSRTWRSSSCERAAHEKDVLLPAYTHRQRAQPISAAFLVGAWAVAVLRAAETIAFAIERTNCSPSAAAPARGRRCRSTAPSSRASSRFPRVTANALHTVGDRDFALDWAGRGARVGSRWRGSQRTWSTSRRASSASSRSTAASPPARG